MWPLCQQSRYDGQVQPPRMAHCNRVQSSATVAGSARSYGRTFWTVWRADPGAAPAEGGGLVAMEEIVMRFVWMSWWKKYWIFHNSVHFYSKLGISPKNRPFWVPEAKSPRKPFQTPQMFIFSVSGVHGAHFILWHHADFDIPWISAIWSNLTIFDHLDLKMAK